ncbi:MAG: GspH/FimT family protein [Gammaproteobacteria bacterium]|nr:GspH/FimT family protein [Gammaproteobacteria bacterium]MDH5799970.1 GspH/FimT family protein [Gammaproteobacteria bacterium]
MAWGRRKIFRNPACGFTLLELLLVLVLVSILVLVVSPALTKSKGFHRTDLKKTARELVSALRYTRSTAIRKAKAVEFKLNPLQSKLWYPAMQVGQWQVLPQTQVLFTTAGSSVRADGSGAIRFFADGSSSGGEIQLSREGRSYTIVVSWLTGKVSLQEG